MKIVTHEKQKEAWEAEHTNPTALLQMDSRGVSGGVEKFYNFLVTQNQSNLSGIEMGCGKGRNVIWLAKQPNIAQVHGFDFSSSAIVEAQKRALEEKVESKALFVVADATETWPYKNESFDFAIDCFASTDIESVGGGVHLLRMNSIEY